MSELVFSYKNDIIINLDFSEFNMNINNIIIRFFRNLITFRHFSIVNVRVLYLTF